MNGKYQSLPALSMSNNCTNLALLKNNCVAYFICPSAVSIIELVLKISLSNADAKDRKFEVMVIKVDPCQNIYFHYTFLFIVYKKVSNFSLTLKQALTLIKFTQASW